MPIVNEFPPLRLFHELNLNFSASFIHSLQLVPRKLNIDLKVENTRNNKFNLMVQNNSSGNFKKK